MLFDIFIQIPSLVMAEFAWCIRCMFIVAMFAGLILIRVGAVGLYVTGMLLGFAVSLLVYVWREARADRD